MAKEVNISGKNVRQFTALSGRDQGGDARPVQERMAALIDREVLRVRDREARAHSQGAELDPLVRALSEAIVRHGGARPAKLGPERFVDSLLKMGFERRISDREVDLLFKKFAVDGKWLGTGEVAQMIRSGWLVFDGRGFAYAD